MSNKGVLRRKQAIINKTAQKGNQAIFSGAEGDFMALRRKLLGARFYSRKHIVCNTLDH